MSGVLVPDDCMQVFSAATANKQSPELVYMYNGGADTVSIIATAHRGSKSETVHACMENLHYMLTLTYKHVSLSCAMNSVTSTAEALKRSFSNTWISVVLKLLLHVQKSLL